MTGGGYEIAHFRPEHESQVLDLLSALWKYERETRARIFRWKYLENPHAASPLGIVALRDGRVAGFRGYFADRFVLDSRNDNIGVLHPGDTCVDPAHRNRGLSVAMGRLAMQYDESRYRLFMNMGCSRQSLPGYLALGFRPLAKRILLLQHGRNPLRWALAAWSKGMAPRPARPDRRVRVESRRFGNLVVTNSPRPAAMAAVVARQARSPGILRLHQDEAFFAWRYRNPGRRYAFCYLEDGEDLLAYVAVDVSVSRLSASIVDFGECEDGALREILGETGKRGIFQALSVQSYAIDERLGRLLAELGFVPVHALRPLFKKGSVEELAFPLLVRPVQESHADSAFNIDGVDTRKIGNWSLKPICSDGA